MIANANEAIVPAMPVRAEDRRGARRLRQTAITRTVAALVVLAGALLTGIALADGDPMAGVTTEQLGSLPSAGAPGYTLVFLRITMQPGASIPAHSHPGDVVVVVQSGKFGTQFVRGEGTLTRAAADGQAPSQETLEAGDSAVLLPGDSLAYGGSAGHTMSNAGDTPLVLLVSALLADGQPGFMFDHQP